MAGKIFVSTSAMPWSLSPGKVPSECVRVILFPSETLVRKHSREDILNRKAFFTDSGVGMKQEIAESLGWGQI